MATRKTVQSVEFTAAQKLGLAASEIPEAQPGVVEGWRMGRTPELVELRKQLNAAIIAKGSAQLIAEAEARLAELASS